jgi:uncharacterized protein YcnI
LGYKNGDTNMKTTFKYLIAALLFGVLILTATASAHVVLDPNEAVVGEQTYSINVPNEKDIPTVELRLVVPDNVFITSILPLPGWNYTTKTEKVPQATTADGDELPTDRIKEIDWTGSFGAGQYQTFGIATYYGGDPVQLVWKAYQTYSDGTIVAWDDTVDGQPAARVTILNETKLDALTNAVNGLNPAMMQSRSNRTTFLEWGVVISILIAGAALIISLRRK